MSGCQCGGCCAAVFPPAPPTSPPPPSPTDPPAPTQPPSPPAFVNASNGTAAIGLASPDSPAPTPRHHTLLSFFLMGAAATLLFFCLLRLATRALAAGSKPADLERLSDASSQRVDSGEDGGEEGRDASGLEGKMMRAAAWAGAGASAPSLKSRVEMHAKGRESRDLSVSRDHAPSLPFPPPREAPKDMLEEPPRAECGEGAAAASEGGQAGADVVHDMVDDMGAAGARPPPARPPPRRPSRLAPPAWTAGQGQPTNPAAPIERSPTAAGQTMWGSMEAVPSLHGFVKRMSLQQPNGQLPAEVKPLANSLPGAADGGSSVREECTAVI